MLIVDTREKKNEHILSHFVLIGQDYVNKKLDVGDYMLEGGKISIDKKFGMQEVYSCLIQGHKRFRRELIRARDKDIKLIVLIESDGISSLDYVHTWRNKRREEWVKLNDKRRLDLIRCKLSANPPVSSKKLEDIMRAMAEQYNVVWKFCKKQQTGQKIIELLREQER